MIAPPMTPKHSILALSLLLLGAPQCAENRDPGGEAPQGIEEGAASTAQLAGSAMERPSPVRAPRPSIFPVAWDGRTRLQTLGDGKIWAFHDGTRQAMTLAEAREQGFTVIDLGDDFTPLLLSEYQPGDPEPKPLPYRQRYLDLANDRTDHHGKPLPRGTHNYLELYGIPPTPSVIRKRFLDETLRACLKDVDREALAALPAGVSAWGFQTPRRQMETLRDAANKLIRRHRLKGREELHRLRGGKALGRRLAKAELRARAVRAALRVLRCEGMLPTRKRAPKADEIWRALTAYERKHMILGRGVLTRDLAREMARGAEEADADAFRRVLRERVAQAAHVLEDGTAARVQKTYRGADGKERPLPNLVRDYQQAALKALGLNSAEKIRHFLTALEAPLLRDLKVAVRLPPRPDYYEDDTMDLEVIISRGDVYYDPPIDEEGNPRSQPRSRLPSLTVWLTWREQRIPLVSWRTTIGGWNDEIKDGQLYLRYKPSNVGPRVWRDIIAAPVWIPPPSTPPKEILSGGKLKTDQMGPGHLSAYGLVAAFHLWPQSRGEKVTYVDQGIRSHGSSNYRSIRAGYSHGCHRLYNHQAIRLFSFLLRHRAHQRVGLEPYPYTNRFEHRGRKYEIKVENRGYVYRLTPPVPITVTRGRVLGKLKKPIGEVMPKPGVVYRSEANEGEDPQPPGPPEGEPKDGDRSIPPGDATQDEGGIRPMPAPEPAPPPPPKPAPKPAPAPPRDAHDRSGSPITPSQ